MGKLPRVSGSRVVRALSRAGFELTHVRGSHHYLRKTSSGLVVVPVHGNRDLPVGTLASILRQAELSTEEFAELLKRG